MEASRFNLCFQSGEIKHTLVLRGGKAKANDNVHRGIEKEVSKHQGEEKTEYLVLLNACIHFADQNCTNLGSSLYNP